MADVRSALISLIDAVGTAVHIPDRNCSCHLSPPCSDCVDWGLLRGAMEDARAAVRAGAAPATPADLRRSLERQLYEDVPLWVCGQVRDAGRWEFQGVFSSEGGAVGACVDHTYFVAQAALNARIKDSSTPWPGAYYPKAGLPPPPAACPLCQAHTTSICANPKCGNRPVELPAFPINQRDEE